MTNTGTDRFRDEILLLARILLIAVFVVFGWSKLTGFEGTVAYMGRTGLPMPTAAAIVAILLEVPVALALGLGVRTRQLALLLAAYTLAAGILGHAFWSMEGAARYGNAINFYKNLGLAGGFLLLFVTGGGRYSVDGRQAARALRGSPANDAGAARP